MNVAASLIGFAARNLVRAGIINERSVGVACVCFAAAVACATATEEDLPSGEGNQSGSGGMSGSSGAGGGGTNPFGGTNTSGGTGATSTGGTGASSSGGSATGGIGGTGTSGTSGTDTGGSSPFGGASSTGGSGNTSGGAGKGGGGAGKGGAGGQAGSNAASGAGGAGGGPVVPPTGECATDPTLDLRYKVNNTGDSIAFDLQLRNLGSAPIAANQLEFQYYISLEESAWQELRFDTFAIQAGTFMPLDPVMALSVDPLMPALGMQTHVVRIRPTDATMLPAGASSTMNITVRLQPNPTAPNQIQTNDFSFDAMHTALAAWDHVAVFVAGTLAWGCTPEP